MPDFIEAVVILLPADAGGRTTAIAPRDGSYRPFARLAEAQDLLRIRVIEGPPRLAPGDAGRVVAEVEDPGSAEDVIRPGVELDLLERDQHLVGMLSVLRVWRTSAL